jgi:hypothetical protein
LNRISVAEEDAERSREDTEKRIHHGGTENTEIKRRILKIGCKNAVFS